MYIMTYVKSFVKCYYFIIEMVFRNTARYDFTHEVLKGEQSFFKDRKIPRERRISIICRNEP